MRLGTKELSLVAILAAVYALGSFLPGFPMIGVPGSRINLVRSLEMSYGLILGSVLGPFTALLGAIVGAVLTGGNMYFTPLAIVSAFTAATLGRKEFFGVRGWVVAALVVAGANAGWYILPAGGVVPYYPVLHLLGLVIILGFRGRLADYLASGDKARLSLGLALTSFPSTMAGHMVGNLIFLSFLNPSPTYPFLLWSILPVTAFERLVITILSTVIGAPLILAVRKIFPELIQGA